MPKRRVASTVVLDERTPIWDELVTELGDPRPYEPLDVDVIVVIDEPCVDHNAFDDVVTDVLDEVERFWHFANELTLEARVALDAIYALPEDDVDDAVIPALAQLDDGATQVLPAWPNTEVVDDPREDAS